MASITTRRRKGGSEAKRDDAAKRATVEAKRDDAAKRAAVEAKADEYAMTDSESDDDDEPSAESLTAARLALGGLEHSMTDLIGEPPAWLTASLAFLGPKVDLLLGALEVAYEIAAPFVAAVAAVAALYVTREGAEVALGLLACVYLLYVVAGHLPERLGMLALMLVGLCVVHSFILALLSVRVRATTKPRPPVAADP